MLSKIIENLNKQTELLQTQGLFPVEVPHVSIDVPLKNRFEDIYLEISNKETDELIKEGNNTFLNEPISSLLKKQDNYLYVESKNFDIIRMESLVLEVDDLFGTYEAIFGLYAPKKAVNEIRNYFGNHKFSMMFNDQDGLWEINFALDKLEGFQPDITLNNVLTIIYEFIFQLQLNLK